MRDRIKELRKSLGLTQAAFAEKIGVKQNTIAQYESGRNNPTDAVLALICREYGVNEVWLRTGIGPMLVPRTREEEIAGFMGRLLLREEGGFKRRFVSALAMLDEDAWEAIERFARSLVEEEAAGDSPESKKEEDR